MSRTPRAVAVIVPANNEAATVASCVASIKAAAGRLPASLSCAVLVVADACTDTTARCAAEAGAQIRTVGWGNVGRSRAAGAQAALQRFDPDKLWLACTDADSVVPRDWLTSQLHAAMRGWDAFAGTVRLGTGPRHMFDEHYRPRQGHHHGHGANLGVRAAAYLHVGGFPPLATGEDVTLLARLRSHRYRVLATAETPVHTSARLYGRAPHGFAQNLRTLSRTAAAAG